MAEHMNFKDNGGPTSPDSAAANIDTALQQFRTPNNKRKRDPSDQGGEPTHPGSKRSPTNAVNGTGHDNNEISRVLYSDNSSPNAPQDFSALSQQIARHVATHALQDNPNATQASAAALAGMMPQLTVPQPTELSFVSTGSGTDGERQLESSFDLGGDNGQNHNLQGSPYGMGGFQGTSGQVQGGRESSNGAKPAVGSEEWHKVRRDNHKEGKQSMRRMKAMTLTDS